MKKRIKYLCLIFLFVMITFLITGSVYAAFDLNTIFDKVNGEFGFSGSVSAPGFEEIQGLIETDIANVIKAVGYLVFAIATVVLGVKYIFSSIEGKSIIKETLPTFVVGIMLFYLGDKVFDLIQGAISDVGIGTSNYTTVSQNIWATVKNIVQVLAFTGIGYVGIKYLFEAPEGKAKIKEKMFPLVMGMVFVFAASELVDFIIQAGSATLT